MEFTSSVEALDEVTRSVKVSIPAATVTREVDSAIANYAQRAAIKGFRPGKAPREIIEKMHGDEVRRDVTSRLISSSISQIVEEQKLDMVGSPEVNLSAYGPGKEIEFTAKISVFPKPEIKGYQNPKVTVGKRAVTEKDVAEVVENMRLSKATMRKLEFRDTAKKDDVADFSVTIVRPGVEPERPEPVVMALGEGKLPKELDEGIVGMKVGEAKEIPVAQDETGGAPKKEDAEAKYRVVLNALNERVLPETDDAFAKSVEFAGAQTLLELRMKIRDELEKKVAEEAKTDVQLAIIDELLEQNPFQIPAVLIDDEIRSMLIRAGLLTEARPELTKEELEKYRTSLGDVAEKRVKSALIVDRIGEQEKLRATEEEINKSIADIAQRNSISVEEARGYLMNKDRVIGFIMEVTRNKVLKYLEEKAEVKYTEKKDDEAKA